MFKLVWPDTFLKRFLLATLVSQSLLIVLIGLLALTHLVPSNITPVYLWSITVIAVLVANLIQAAIAKPGAKFWGWTWASRQKVSE